MITNISIFYADNHSSITHARKQQQLGASKHGAKKAYSTLEWKESSNNLDSFNNKFTFFTNTVCLLFYE